MGMQKLRIKKNNIACVTCGKGLYYYGDQVEELEIECEECREEDTTF